jgi:hypothetical protein
MNCHPSLRKGTSSGLLAHSRQLSFGLSAHFSAADNGAAPRDDTETCAHAPARAGCSGRRPSVPRQGERRNYSASSSRHAGSSVRHRKPQGGRLHSQLPAQQMTVAPWLQLTIPAKRSRPRDADLSAPSARYEPGVSADQPIGRPARNSISHTSTGRARRASLAAPQGRGWSNAGFGPRSFSTVSRRGSARVNESPRRSLP